MALKNKEGPAGTAADPEGEAPPGATTSEAPPGATEAVLPAGFTATPVFAVSTPTEPVEEEGEVPAGAKEALLSTVSPEDAPAGAADLGRFQ